MNADSPTETEFRFATEEDHRDVSRSLIERSLYQLSLAEVLFVVTLSAISIWLYITFSPLVAMLAAGCLVVIASVRWYGSRHAVLGGLCGFGSALIVTCLIAMLHQTDPYTTALLVLVGPALGYLIGAVMSVLRDDAVL